MDITRDKVDKQNAALAVLYDDKINLLKAQLSTESTAEHIELGNSLARVVACDTSIEANMELAYFMIGNSLFLTSITHQKKAVLDDTLTSALLVLRNLDNESLTADLNKRVTAFCSEYFPFARCDDIPTTLETLPRCSELK